MSSKLQKPFAFRTEGNPAPGELVRVHGFLNTWSDELEIEDLATPRTAEAWLRSAEIWRGRKAMNADDHARVIEFRALVRAWVLNRQTASDVVAAVPNLNFTLAAEDDGLVLTPNSASACDEALGRFLIIILDSMRNGTWQRFKCCALPTCGWAYYDTSRSRTKRWCSMTTCGSRHKAREYYRRNRDG